MFWIELLVLTANIAILTLQIKAHWYIRKEQEFAKKTEERKIATVQRLAAGAGAVRRPPTFSRGPKEVSNG